MVKNVKIFEREEVKIPEWAPVVIAKTNNEDKVKETLVLNIKEVSINIKDGFNKKTLEDVLEVITKVC